MSVAVEITGVEEVIALFNRVTAEGQLHLMRYLGEELTLLSHEAFEKEADPVTGHGWPSLNQATVRRKGHDAILTDGGDLRRSIEYAADQKQVIFGSTKVYAATHQFGRDAIPQRRFLPDHPSVIRRILEQPEVANIIGIRR